MSPPGREVQYTESDVIEVFKDRGDYAEPLTAKEIADRLGCGSVSVLSGETTRRDIETADQTPSLVVESVDDLRENETIETPSMTETSEA